MNPSLLLKRPRHQLARMGFACAALTFAFCATAAEPAAKAKPQAGAQSQSQSSQSQSDTQARYEKERATCTTGMSQQDYATCMREAAAARDERKAGKLDDGQSKEELRRNALMRCRAVPEKDRAACESRARGEGIQEGSVKGGGIVKETREVTIGIGASSPRP